VTEQRAQRVTVNLLLNLTLPDRTAFVANFARNISQTGLFIRTKNPPAVGTRIQFEYRLADDTRVLKGAGVVRWARDDEADSELPAGVGVEFIDLDPEAQRLVDEIVAAHGPGARAGELGRRRTTAVQMAQLVGARSKRALDELLGAEADAAVQERLGIDLCGATIRTAMLQNHRLSRQQATAPRVGYRGDHLQVQETGAWLPHIVSWAAGRWPSPRVQDLADLAGTALVPNARVPTFALAGRSVEVSAALRSVVRDAAARGAESTPRAATVILPHTAVPGVGAAVGACLQAMGIEEWELRSDAEAVLALGPAQHAPLWTVLVQIGQFETRVAACLGGRVRAGRSCPGVGSGPARMAIRTAARVGEDVGLLQALDARIPQDGREATDVGQDSAALDHAIVCAIDEVLEAAQVQARDEVTVQCAADEFVWRGLRSAIDRALALRMEVVDEGPWARLSGVLL
jgi:uncharacterized protein (TIGR02266 family)